MAGESVSHSVVGVYVPLGSQVAGESVSLSVVGVYVLYHWAARWQVSQSHSVWWVHVSYTTEPLSSQMAGESVSHSVVGACVLYH